MESDNTAELWQKVLEDFQKELSPANFKTWFLSTRLDSIDPHSETATVVTPNNFISSNLQKKYNEQIITALNSRASELNHPKTSTLSFITVEAKRKEAPRKNTASVSNTKTSTNHRSAESISDPRSIILPINARYTFQNFVVGSSNELAYTVAQAIAKDPGQRFNPLFIYGGVGLGKTHLIQAVANAILEDFPTKKVVYSSTQTYVSDFLESIRNKTTSQFSKTYKEADVLVIDDIQFIAGKDKTTEEFFHTFNLLHQSNKQIIISADQPPRSIPTLPDRLRSRFEWGMTIDIQSPDFETRCAIIQSKAEAHQIDIPYEIVEFIASNIKNNIRELEGAVNQIIVRCQVQNITPTLSFVKELLKSSTKGPKQFTAKTIIEACCDHFGTEESDVMSARRDKDISNTRQIAMYLMRTELKLSLPKIAASVNRKDHTTAIHSIKKISESLEFDLNLKRSVNSIRQKLYE
jgi:chromosomal replication initiator protein